MIDLFIHWNVNPELISFGPLTIRWYGLLYACAFLVSFYALRELLKHDKLPEEFCYSTLMYFIIGTIVGARIGDCLFYHPRMFIEEPLKVFAIWEGGLSSHGGACGILIALYLLSRKYKKPYIWILDRLVIVIGVAGFFIRTGNLMNSEIYGHTTSLPWGFIFERNGETEPKHPTQIYEALYYALVYVILRFVYRKVDNRPRPYMLFGLFLILVFGFRISIEFIKNPQEAFEQDMFLNMGQLLSLPFFIAGIVCLIISRYQKRPEPIKQRTPAQPKIKLPKEPSQSNQSSRGTQAPRGKRHKQK